MAFELEHVTIHGHDVGFRKAGSGPVVLLIHGIAGSSSAWRAVMPVLAERYTVIAPDLIGHNIPVTLAIKGDTAINPSQLDGILSGLFGREAPTFLSLCKQIKGRDASHHQRYQHGASGPVIGSQDGFTGGIHPSGMVPEQGIQPFLAPGLHGIQMRRKHRLGPCFPSTINPKVIPGIPMNHGPPWGQCFNMCHTLLDALGTVGPLG